MSRLRARRELGACDGVCLESHADHLPRRNILQLLEPGFQGKQYTLVDYADRPCLPWWPGAHNPKLKLVPTFSMLNTQQTVVNFPSRAKTTVSLLSAAPVTCVKSMAPYQRRLSTPIRTLPPRESLRWLSCPAESSRVYELGPRPPPA